MELDLKTKNIRSMQLIDETVIFHEETGEVIVPDTQPDVVRIIDTFTNVLLKSKEAEQGRVVLKGILQTTVLYVSGDECVYRLEQPIAFTILNNNQNVTSDCAVTAVVESVMTDAVISNSRKVIARINLKAKVSSFLPEDIQLCEHVEDEQIFQKTGNTKVSYMSEYTEKTFVVSDDIVLNDESEFEIIGCEHKVINTSYSLSGTKLIVKGDVESVLYWMPADQIMPLQKCCITEFSQLIDIDDAENVAFVNVNVMLNGCYCDYGMYSQNGSKPSAAIEIHAVAQCEIFKSEELSILDDLYSVSGEIEAEWNDINCVAEIETESSTVRIREEIDSSCPFDNVMWSRIRFGEAQFENDHYKVNGYITLTGETSEKEVMSLKYSFQVTCSSKQFDGEIGIKAENAEIEIANGTIILNCDVCLTSCKRSFISVKTLKRATVNEIVGNDERPSAVLYRVREGDTVWDICKKYFSSCEIVNTVNNIEEEMEISAGMLILIPKI